MDWVRAVFLRPRIELSYILTLTHRYVEWEKYPDKKAAATKILNTKKFTPIPGGSEQRPPLTYT